MLEGSETRVEAAAVKTAKMTQTENGCLAYDFYRDLEKPCHYTLVERWEGLEPLRKHLASEHIREFQVLLAEIGTTPRTADVYALVDGNEFSSRNRDLRPGRWHRTLYAPGSFA